MQEIKGNSQVYTTQEGTKNWIHTNLYQETALFLDSFFWLKVEASTIYLYNYYPSIKLILFFQTNKSRYITTS